MRTARDPGENRIPAELVTAMFMGDRSEHLFKLGSLRLRGYGTDTHAAGAGFLELPAGRSLGVRDAGLRSRSVPVDGAASRKRPPC
jgi:iron(III) transport system ATP-binding protein